MAKQNKKVPWFLTVTLMTVIAKLANLLVYSRLRGFLETEGVS